MQQRLQRKRRFTDAWSCRDDDQVGRLPSSGEVIQRAESGGNPCHVLIGVEMPHPRLPDGVRPA
ncbi:hypothetical protein PXO_05542 [Xanthomonas oryzae pv. oryzae PXO99A]|uniref:Uncharacterized protein n=1 Tax=Xanthomonas oryzae pv. oryzae (strain PXO99A) TaxID=360094 RepID=A0A0K0GJF0_XANOP|nr:hypothetical protein PXO_05542 [Xanthomonas oryzae pv. oryzae PXO99A]